MTKAIARDAASGGRLVRPNCGAEVIVIANAHVLRTQVIALAAREPGGLVGKLSVERLEEQGRQHMHRDNDVVATDDLEQRTLRIEFVPTSWRRLITSPESITRVASFCPRISQLLQSASSGTTTVGACDARDMSTERTIIRPLQRRLEAVDPQHTIRNR